MKNKKGFTLIELLATILIISIIFSISTYFVLNTINNSKEKAKQSSLNSIKKTANIYIQEYPENIVWTKGENNNDNTQTCVYIGDLIEYGYFKEDQINNIDSYKDSYLILTKNKNNTIIKEQLDEDGTCNSDKGIKIPTSKDCKKNLTYDKYEQKPQLLVNQPDTEKGYEYIETEDLPLQRTEAGEYKVTAKLLEDNTWTDGTKEDKTIKCSIQKAVPKLSLTQPRTGIEISESNGTSTNKQEINLTSYDVKGKLTIKSSNKNYAIGTLEKETIDKGETIKVTIETFATRDITTYINITLNPDDTKNYHTTTITYNINNIDKNQIPLPKPEDYCKQDLTYTGETQDLVNYPLEDEGFILKNTTGKDAGTYTITAQLKYGYIWINNEGEIIDTKDKTFTCEIKEPPIKVILTLKKDNTECTTCNGYAIHLSKSQTTDTKELKITTTENKTLEIDDGLTKGTKYYVWVAKDEKHKTEGTDNKNMAYSGISFTARDTIEETINFYTLTIAQSNTTTTANETNIGNNESLIVLGGTNTTADNYNHAIKANVANPQGYTFDTWTINNGTATIANPTSAATTIKIASPTKITATARPLTYEITYKDCGDTDFSGTHTNGYPASYTYGIGVTLDTPTRTNYTFKGYYTTNTCTGTPITNITETSTDNKIIYAKWLKNNYLNINKNTYYEKLKDAFDEAENEHEIRVEFDNIEETTAATVAANKSLKLDMNGKTTILKGVGITIANAGALDIYTKKSGGTLMEVATNSTYLITNNGTFTTNKNSSIYELTLTNASTASNDTATILANSTDKIATLNSNTTLSFSTPKNGNAERYIITNYGILYIDGATLNNYISEGNYARDCGITMQNANSRVIMTSGIINVGGTGISNGKAIGKENSAAIVISEEQGKTTTIHSQNLYGILLNAAGELNITGGTISSVTSVGIRNYTSGGTINLSGGEVKSTSSYGIQNFKTLNITGGTVSSTSNVAIEERTTGFLTINGGTILSESSSAINNQDSTNTINILSGFINSNNANTITNHATANINIYGGTITNTSTTAGKYTINNQYSGTIDIKNNATVSSENGKAIRNAGKGTTNISGNATISSITGTAIHNDADATINISGTPTISSSGIHAIYVGNSTVTITGGTISSSGNHTINNYGASAILNISGGTITNTSTSAKYTIFNRTSTSITNISGTATISSQNGTVIHNDAAGSINIESGTIFSNSSYGIYNKSSGTITITGGSISSNGTYTIRNYGANSILNIAGGTITNTSTSTGSNAIQNQNNTSTVNISGTAVITSQNGNTIANANGGLINIEGGTITSNTQSAIDNQYRTGRITISGGTISGATQGIYNNQTANIIITGGNISGNTNGIYNYGAGTINVSNSTITGTSSGNGIKNRIAGTINITDSNVSGTTGIYNEGNGIININGNSTTIIGTTAEGIKAAASSPTKIEGGNIIGNTYGINIGGGTVIMKGGTATGGVNGVNITSYGSLYMGENTEEEPSITIPEIKSTGTTEGYGINTVQNSNVYFYDGKIIARQNSTLVRAEKDRPEGYAVVKTNENNIETAILKPKHTITLQAGIGVDSLAGTNWTGTGTTTLTKTFKEGDTIDLNTITPTYTQGYSGGIWSLTTGVGALSETTFTVGAGNATLTFQPIINNYKNLTTNIHYTRLVDAFAAASSGDIIQVLRGTNEDFIETTDAIIDSSKSIILDMNGKTTTLSNATIINSGTLDIYTSQTGGTLQGNTTIISNNGVLTTNIKDNTNLLTLANTSDLKTARIIINNNQKDGSDQ